MTKETAQPKALNILRPSQPLTSSKQSSVLSGYSSTSNNSQQLNSRKPRVTSVAQLHLSSSEKPQLNIYHPPSLQQQQQLYLPRNSTIPTISGSGSNLSSSSSSSSSSSRPSNHYYRLSENEHDSRRKPTSSSTLSAHHPSYHAPTKERPPIEIYKPASTTKQRAVASGHPSYPKSSSMTKSFTAPIITTHNKSNSAPHSAATTLPSAPESHPTSPKAKYSGMIPTTYQHSAPSNNHSNNYSHHLQHDHTQQDHRYQVRKHAGSFSSTPTSLSASDDDSDQQGNYDSDNDEEKDLDKSDGELQEDQESTVLNEARVNRQIADLEISNQSLLAVNAMLEATVRKQASEMAQMKKQMTITDNGVHVTPLVLPLPTSEISEDEWENDKTFQRLCCMTDKMIEQAQRAMSFEFKGMGRVISYSEQQEEDDDDRLLEDDDDNQLHNI